MERGYDVLLLCSNSEEYSLLLQLQEQLLARARQLGQNLHSGINVQVAVAHSGRDLQRAFLDGGSQLRLAILFGSDLNVAAGAIQGFLELFPEVSVFIVEGVQAPASGTEAESLALRSLEARG
jgi:hypothetical protein